MRSLLCLALLAGSISAQPIAWFSDSFTGGMYFQWEVQPPIQTGATWSVVDEAGNKVLALHNAIRGFAIPVRGADFRYVARVKLMSAASAVMLDYRITDCGASYRVLFAADRVALQKVECAGAVSDLQSVSEAHNMGQWYALEINGAGANLKVSLDTTEKIAYTDASPIRFGRVSVMSGTDADVRVDDVQAFGQSPAVVIVNQDLPDAVANTPYSFTLTASGGTAPLTWSAAPDSLPSGLSLSPTGTLSGSLADPGTHSMLVEVTDLYGFTALQPLSLNVTAFGISTDRALPVAVAGSPYTVTLQATPADPGYSWSADSLPPGLSLNPSTGVISGTPPTPGNNWLNVHLTSGGSTVTKMFGLYVTGPGFPLTLNVPASPDMSAGQQQFSWQLAPWGGTPPFTWSVVSGMLPPGMNLASGTALPQWANAWTALVSGWPTTAGIFTFEIRVTDSTGASYTAPMTLTVSWMHIYGGFQSGTFGAAYPGGTLTAAGGQPPYAWSVLNNVPTGMTFSSSGVLSGTPTECGSFSPQLRVVDGVQNQFRPQTGVFIACGTPVTLSINTDSVILGAGVGRPFGWSAGASGGNGNYTWDLTSGTLPPGLTLDKYPGYVYLSGTPSTEGTYTFQLRATDSAGGLGIRNLTIKVSPVVVANPDLPPGLLDVPYSAQLIATNGTGPYAYVLTPGQTMPPGLSLDPSGQISGTPSRAGSYSINVAATDAASNVTWAAYSINIASFGITSSRALPLATQGSYYYTNLVQSGGSGCTWSASNLPSGLTIDPSTGVISGTPISWWNYQVGVTLSCASGVTGAAFGLIVQPIPAQSLQLQTPPAFQDTSLGDYYTSPSLFAAGGVPPYTWSVAPGSVLPPGLKLLTGDLAPSWASPYSAMLGGWPTTAGTYTFTLTATDSTGAKASGTYTLHISPLHITNGPPPGTMGAPYSFAFSGSGGTAPYTWSVVSGDLPAGITLAPNGTLTGTPLESGTLWFEVQISDSAPAPNTLRRWFSIYISSGTPVTLEIWPGKQLNGTLGYNEFQLGVSNETMPFYQWEMTAGSLPPGIALATPGANPNAYVRGTTTTPGKYTFTLRVTDSLGNAGVREFTLTVPPFALEGTSLINAVVGAAYSRPFMATGATGSVTWASDPSAPPPPGLTILSGGALSGTPTTPGTYTFNTIATDSAGKAASFTLTLTVDALNIAMPAILPMAVQGTPYLVTTDVTGGSGPYTWAVSGGTFPGWLSLDQSTGALSGTPNGSGRWDFSLRVADSTGESATRNFSLPVNGPSGLPLALRFDTAPQMDDMTLGRSSAWGIFASGGTPPYLYSVEPGSTLPPGLYLLQGSSLPSGAWPLQAVLDGAPLAAGDYSFTLRVSDSAGAFVTRTFTRRVSVLNLEPYWSPLPNATLGTPYSTSLTALNGTAPYTFTNAGDPLPAGLSLDPSGQIYGTPAETGNVSITLRVADSASHTLTRSYNLYIAGGAFGPYIGGLGRTLRLQRGAWTSDPLMAYGGVPPYAWSIDSGALPPGIFLLTGNALPYWTGTNAAILSGVTAAPGVYNFTLRVADSSPTPNVALQNITLTVSPLAVLADLPPANQGVAYNAKPAAAGGTAPYTFALESGSVLPAGLSLAADGTLFGTPTAFGGYDFSVTVTDGAAPANTYTFGVHLDIYKVRITTGAMLGTYPVALAAAGGTAPYTWTQVGGTLPPGIMLDSSGVLVGVSSCSAATYTVQLRATDAAGLYAVKRFTLPCLPLIPTAPRFNTGSNLADASVGENIFTPIYVSDGMPPYTVELASGSSLPPGLLLLSGNQLPDSAAPGLPLLWGRPSAPGEYDFTLTATDSKGLTANRTFHLHVSPLSIGQFTIRSSNWFYGPSRGIPYVQQLTGGNGTPPYTWSAAGPLPNGLSLLADGTLTGTPIDTGSYTIPVRITDGAGLTYTRTFGIYINSNMQTSLRIDTEPPITWGLGVGASTITASGGTQPYTWNLESGALPPGVVLLAGSSVPGGVSPNDAVIAGAVSTPGTYTFTLRVTDAGGNTGYRTFTLGVVSLFSPITSLAPGTLGQAYSQQLVVMGGAGTYTFVPATDAVLPPGLTLSTSGLLSGIPTAGGAYNFTVTVSDTGGRRLDIGYSLVVAGTYLKITTSPDLPNGILNATYPGVTLAASGGTAPYTYSLARGSLPSGLALSSNGTISGKPTSTGNYTVTILVADSAAQTNTKVFALSVLSGAAPRPLAISNSASMTPVSVNEALSITLGAYDGTPPYVSWTAPGGLPAGLGLLSGNQLASGDRPGTVRLAGAIATPGTYTFTLRVTDNAGATADRTFTLPVSPLGLQPSSLRSGALGASYSASLQAAGGTGPYTFSIAGGGLPAGLSMNSAGLITGVPQETGSYSFTAQVTDSSAPANVFTRSVSLFIAAGTPATLRIDAGPRLPDSSLRRDYSTTISVSGGTAPYTWALAPGSSLPPGLILVQGAAAASMAGASSNSAVILGAGATAGQYTFTLRVTDSAGNLSVRIFNLLVTPLVNSTRAFDTLQANQPASLTLAVAGGAAPYTWALAPDSTPPPGMTLASNGALSGSPTQSGGFSFNATATDSAGKTLNQTFTVTVRPFVITTDYDLGTIQAGVPYSRQIQANGGAAPVTWTGSIPIDGLTLASNGTISGTPTTLGNRTISITATDAAGWQVTRRFHLQVEPQGGRPLLMSMASPFNARAGLPLDVGLLANGGTPPYTWSVAPGSTLPAGLAIVQAGAVSAPQFTPGFVGLLSGVIATPGVYTFTLQVADSAAATVSRTFTLEVTNVTLSPGSLSATAGTPFQASLIANGGTGPYTFAVNAPLTRGVLPPGLTMTANGVISGTPTDPGYYNPAILVTDSSTPPKTAQRFLNINVNPSTPGGLRMYSNGSWLTFANNPFVIDLSASGGTAPYTFAVVPGTTLPPSLVLEGTEIIGIPTAGNFNLYLQVSDAAGATVKQIINLEVVPMSFSPATLPYATAGTPFSQAITLNGGTAPKQVSIETVPPPGLTFNAAGVLSGTPTTPGIYGVTLMGYDSSSPYTLYGDATLPLVVNAPGCTFAGTGGPLTPPAEGATGSPIPFTTGSTCNWIVVNTASWVHVTSPLTGTGSGSVLVDVDPNTKSITRRTTIQIGGQPFTIAQPPGTQASSSKLTLTGGTLAGQTLSAAAPTVTVLPGAAIAGSFTVQAVSSFASGTPMAFAMTPTWGAHASAFTDLGALSTPTTGMPRTVSVNTTAPATPGTYYLITAFAAESSAAYLMSATSSAAGAPVWNDSDDIAAWPQTTIDAANANGNLLVAYRDILGSTTGYVAATAIRIVVTPPSGPSGLRFVPVIPCRVADTRVATNKAGFAGQQNFPVAGICGVPANAGAYSFNVSAIPRTGVLGFLAIWPAGEPQPVVSTLNSYDGRVKADAAIVPAGAGGAVSVYTSDKADVFLDINGYFVPAASAPADALVYYPVAPCRAADTRTSTGKAGFSGSLPIPLAGVCGLPGGAQAYAVNFTVLPRTASFSFLSAWPTGQTQPGVSTLNAFNTGGATAPVTANSAIVPAGMGGSIDVYHTDAADLLVDITGYFAPPGAGGLSFYTATPCRVVDTRTDTNKLGFEGTRAISMLGAPCELPMANVYSLNATVIPRPQLDFLTLWPTGGAQPGVSTLNSFDGSVVSNAALVPATSGSISAYHTQKADLFLDVNGYFAP